MRGTVIGVRAGATVATAQLDVLFDETFVGARQLRAKLPTEGGARCYRVSTQVARTSLLFTRTN